MATGRASKNTKKLENMHKFYHKKVEQVEKERNYDRSWDTKVHLINLKKEMLKAKDNLKK